VSRLARSLFSTTVALVTLAVAGLPLSDTTARAQQAQSPSPPQAAEPTPSNPLLGATTGKRGPGPLVTAMTGKSLGRLHIPVTVVQDSLTTEDIDAVT